MKYSAPLDGIRALAILAVLVYHVDPERLRGGFTGVDVFFVLSGFLITSIILEDLRNGRFSLREFYLRRFQRILPNAIAMVLVALALTGILLPRSALREVGRHAVWALVNASNFFIKNNIGGYWDNSADSAPLLHTWSLAVEEQFYFVFPASMVLLARHQRARVSGWLLFAASMSLALCVWITPHRPAASFLMLPTRVWELLMGAALASYTRPLDQDSPRQALRKPMLAEAGGWIGLLLVGGGYLMIGGSSGFPGATALIPAVGTVFLIISVEQGATATRFLAMPLMVMIGKLSYSLYLWHWPLITFGRTLEQAHALPAPWGRLGGAILSCVLAWGAYVIVEQPLRRRGPGRASRLAAIACGLIVAVLASAWAANAPKLNTTRFFDAPEFRGLAYSVGAVPADPNRAIRFSDVRFPPVTTHNDEAWRTGGIAHLFGTRTPEVVVMGSSHATMYSSIIDSICGRLGVSVDFYGMRGVPVFFNASVDPAMLDPSEAPAFDEARRRWLRTWHPRVLFLIDRWDVGYKGGSEFAHRLHALLAEVAPVAGEVVFVAQVPVADIGGSGVNFREVMYWRYRHVSANERVLPDADEAKRREAVAIAEAAKSEFPNLRVLRPDLAFYEEDGSVRWRSGRTVYYADDNHLSEAGANVVRGLFEQAISEMASPGFSFNPAE